MEPFYTALFGALASVTLVILLSQRSDGSIVPKTGEKVSAFVALRNNYVLVYAMMMAGDWLQGPYVYALYEYYGYSQKDIGRLFIAGFGSSMIFGTVVGALADKHGRKKAALLYVITYSLSCATKHSSNYNMLLVGRLLGGIATSLLFSAFESWIVAEHFAKGFDGKWLGDTFSKAVFVGNGLVAILAGLFANYLVEGLSLGPVAPFTLAAAVLLLGGTVILVTWGENYGDSKNNSSLGTQFKLAWKAITSDSRVALLGAMQSLFEASMYSFVFLWTPALSPSGEKIPHGMIFSCFMSASMVGSALSGVLMKRSKPEEFMKYVFGVGALSLSVPCFFQLNAGDRTTPGAWVEAGGISLEGQAQLMAFCVFEAVVGVFWPSMMTMRAAFVPEDLRSTIINCFRIPLNLFTCIVLFNVHLFPLAAMFGLCSVFLAIAALCQMHLQKIAHSTPPLDLKNLVDGTEPLLGAEDS
eukprot:gene11227-18856_t